ncbi:hypothetical protein V8G56_05995 [Gaetbulibacter aquiaggeris]|uniref:Uncharacterized protein n=1 Tax=Gaetbulibacter aquiaggeris TaxID=1735373 RepID=A0ABW7MN82_9FLAO
MIKLFSNIRKKLLAEGKTANYLKYAIGEIVLVMIGILLALQVNSWNQSRLERIDEKNILAKLHDEFLENKNEVNKSTAIFKSAMNANIVLMSLVGSDTEELQKHDLDSLFYESLPSMQIVFSNNTIKNIVLSGKLNVIKNPEIIQLINQWEAHTVLLKEREQILSQWLNNQLIPFISDYVAFKEIDHNGNMPWSGKSKLKPDYHTLFQQLKYENILDNVLWYHNKNRISLEMADDLIEKIIDATKSYN